MAEVIHTNSAHQRVITKHYRRLFFVISSSGADGKVRVEVIFDAIDRGTNPRFAELFSPAFSNQISRRKVMNFQQ